MRTTPDRITELRPGEIFVFGSNLAGMHGGGADPVGQPEVRGRLGTGGWAAGRELCHPHHAGRSGDDPSLCGRVHRFRPAASPDDVSRHGDRLRDCGFHARGDRPAVRSGPSGGEHPPPRAVLGRTRPVIRCVPAGRSARCGPGFKDAFSGSIRGLFADKFLS